MSNEIVDERPSDGYGTIYAIVHEPSGRRYIGSTTTRLSDRLSNHRRELDKGCHGNAQLQSDWTGDGAESFYVEILENAVPRQSLRGAESIWMERLNTGAGIYNRQRRGPLVRSQFGQTTFVAEVERMERGES